MQIRSRLVLLMLSILAPAFLAAALAVWYVYGEQKAAQEKAVSEAAHTLALLVDNDLRTREATLLALANAPALARGDLSAFYSFARSLAPDATTTIVLTDLQGSQLINTRRPFGTELPRSRPNIVELRQQQGPTGTVVSDMFLASTSQRHDFAVQVPVVIEGKLRYYLSMGMEVTKLQSLWGNSRLPEGWVATILDRNGVVIARSREADKFVARRASERLTARILAREPHGIHVGTTLDGVETVGFFNRAPMSGWTAIVNIPRTQIYAPAVHAATFLSTAMLLLLGVAILIARWQTAKTTGPIEALRRAAESLGRGEPVSMVPTGLAETDVAGRAMVAAGDQLRRAQSEMETRVSAAVVSAERSQRALLHSQKVEALGRLTAGIAHDFNNILQTLSTALQLIHLRAPDPKVQSLTQTCQRALDRATELTGKLRSFGRVQDANLTVVDLAAQIESAMPLLKSALPSHIEFTVDVEPDVCTVTVDALQLELSLLNLIVNARDAMPAGGRVQLRASNIDLPQSAHGLEPGAYVRLTVSDNGSGMPSEVLAQALEPFYTTKPADKGSGLGLPQAYGFAKQSGGTLTIDSEAGKGTTVAIYLAQSGAQAVTRREGTDGLLQAAGTGTILFVEDDPLVRDAVAGALRAAGFDVLSAANGDEALALIEGGRHFDQLFSDIMMPGATSGIALAQFVRERYPEKTVILATGYTDTRVTVPGVRLLAKPYDIGAAVQFLTSKQDEAL